MNSIFDRFKISPILNRYDALATLNVPDGTIANGMWVNCRDYPITTFWIFRETVGGASDFFDVCKVVQASTSTGTGVKDVTGLKLTVDQTALATGSVAKDVAILELDTEALDVANSFGYASVILALSADNGTNYTTVIAVQGQSRYAFRGLNMRAIADASALISKVMT